MPDKLGSPSGGGGGFNFLDSITKTLGQATTQSINLAVRSKNQKRQNALLFNNQDLLYRQRSQSFALRSQANRPLFMAGGAVLLVVLIIAMRR